MPDFNYIFNSPFLNIDGDQDGGNSHIEPINFCPIFIPLFECQVSGVSVQRCLGLKSGQFDRERNLTMW